MPTSTWAASHACRVFARFIVALSAMFVVLAAPTSAETWPSRPIRLIVPHAPSGVTDLVARLVAQPLGEALRQSVIVENKPGDRALWAPKARHRRLSLLKSPSGHGIGLPTKRVADAS